MPLTPTSFFTFTRGHSHSDPRNLGKEKKVTYQQKQKITYILQEFQSLELLIPKILVEGEGEERIRIKGGRGGRREDSQ